MSASHVFGKDDPGSYQAAVDAAGVVELPTGARREALYRELFGDLYDPERMCQPDQIRTPPPEPDVAGGA